MKLFLTTLIGLFALTVHAQTADEIIQKHAATMGGLDVLNNVKTYKTTGTVSAQGNDLSLTIQVINGKSMRSDVEVMGQSVVNVYDNGKGWTINPFTGGTEATDLTGPQLTELKSQAFLASNLIDYKNRGHQVETDGQEDVEGVKCFKLKLKNKDDDKSTTFYISTADYILIKAVSVREIMGEEAEMETYFSDLKDFNGVRYFMTRIQKLNGQVISEFHVDKFELNVPVDEAIFKKQ